MTRKPARLTLHDTGRHMDVYVAVLPATDSSTNFLSGDIQMTTTRVQRKQAGTALLVAGCSFLGLLHGEALAQGHRFQATNVCELTAT